MTNYEYLIAELDAFIRKYYLNQIIKGVLWTVGLTMLMWLVFSVLESQFYFGQTVRKVFFYGFIGVAGAAAAKWIISPSLKYFKLGLTLSHDKAALIIGQHFSQVEDKLLNVLQLENAMHQQSSVSKELIRASIEQKSNKLKLTPFRSAIDLSKNKKHLRWALPPLMIILGLLAIAPSIVKDSTKRIIRNDLDFERAMPFSFILENDKLSAIQNSDLKVKLRVDGEALPQKVELLVNGFGYEMHKISDRNYEYNFRNLNRTTAFQFSANGFQSKDHIIDVIEKPHIVEFKVDVDVPAYTGQKDYTLQGIGDMMVPEGSKVNWTFKTQGAKSFDFIFKGLKQESRKSSEGTYALAKTIRSNSDYLVKLENPDYGFADSVLYSIQVVKDKYPGINLEVFVDSSDQSLSYFSGTVSDDYGLSKLEFHYSIKDGNGAEKTTNIEKVPLSSGSLSPFEYIFDLNKYVLSAGDQIQYYFEVFDNDRINGAKSSKSKIFNHRKAKKEEVKEEMAKNTKESLEKMKDRLKKAQEIQEKLKKLREKLLQKKEADWQDKKELEKILQEQNELQKEIDEIKKNLEENLENQKDINPEKEEMIQKQEELKDLFEKMMDNETKELMEKIQELMEKLNKEKILEMSEQMETNEEEMEQEMERMMELYKQLDLENRMNEELEKLDELAKKQEELAEKTKEEGITEENKKAQEEIEKEFDEIKEEMDQIKEENKELENKVPFGDLEEEEKEVEENLDDAEEQMEQGDQQKTSESQQKSSESMQKMSETMKGAMEGGAGEQQQEDIKVLRQILENLVTISFEQEFLIQQLDRVAVNTPKYIENVQVQSKLIDDFEIVEDSLIALSKRNAQIETYVLEKVNDVQSNFHKAKEDLEERKTSEGQNSQQRAMTNINDLALMLSESMAQMQQQQGEGMPGNQNCNKPGGSNPKPASQGQPKDKMSKSQKSLNQQMQSLMQRMKDGGQGSSEEFAKMAAKQAALRKALKEQERGKQQQGKNGQELQKLIDEMNKTEKELVNKKLTAESLKRQEMIVTRLLESERAERERGKDEKRKSEDGEDINRKYPPGLEDYLQKRRSEIEQYRKVNPDLTPFYKKMVEDYFESLQK